MRNRVLLGQSLPIYPGEEQIMKTTGILIDPFLRMVRKVSIEQSNGKLFDDIYRQMKCQLVAIGHEFEDRSVLFVDDEGLFKSPEFLAMFALVDGHGQLMTNPLSGIAMIVGPEDDAGNSAPVTLTAHETDRMVRWVKPEFVASLADGLLSAACVVFDDKGETK